MSSVYLLATLSLVFTQNGATLPTEAPFKATDRAMIVDAVINGKKASFMFDTGFSGYIIISDSINIGKATGTMTLRDFVGQFQVSTVPITSIEMGGLKISNLRGAEAVQQPMAHIDYTLSYGTHCDGIMGYSVIKDFVTEINFEKSKFIFHPKSVDITKRTPDNKRTFLVKMHPRGMNAIELEALINGKPLQLALDTGNAFYATTHKEVLERVGVWNPNDKPKYMSQAWVASGPVDSFSIWIHNATIFGVPVEWSIWDIIDLPSSTAEHDGTVGFGFLKHFNIIMDYERRYVWLENFTGKVTDEPEGEIGMLITRNSANRLEIWKVIPGGPADVAGIKEKDILMAVNGKSVSMVNPKQIGELLRGKPGTKVQIAVSRQGAIQRFEVERKVLANGTPPDKITN